jgi:hypothetical protein
LKIKIKIKEFSNAKTLEKEMAFDIACARAEGGEAVVFLPKEEKDAQKFYKCILTLLKKYKKMGIVELFLPADELSENTREGAYMLNKLPELPELVVSMPNAICVKL